MGETWSKQDADYVRTMLAVWRMMGRSRAAASVRSLALQYQQMSGERCASGHLGLGEAEAARFRRLAARIEAGELPPGMSWDVTRD